MIIGYYRFFANLSEKLKQKTPVKSTAFNQEYRASLFVIYGVDKNARLVNLYLMQESQNLVLYTFIFTKRGNVKILSMFLRLKFKALEGHVSRISTSQSHLGI